MTVPCTAKEFFASDNFNKVLRDNATRFVDMFLRQNSADNLLEETHPLFNVVTRQVEASERYFSARPLQLP